jgi:hypothetical protein
MNAKLSEREFRIRMAAAVVITAFVFTWVPSYLGLSIVAILLALAWVGHQL